MSQLLKARELVKREFNKVLCTLIAPDFEGGIDQSNPRNTPPAVPLDLEAGGVDEASGADESDMLAAARREALKRLDPQNFCDIEALRARLAAALQALQTSVLERADELLGGDEEGGDEESSAAMFGAGLAMDAVMALVEKVCAKVMEVAEPLLQEIVVAVNVKLQDGTLGAGAREALWPKFGALGVWFQTETSPSASKVLTEKILPVLEKMNEALTRALDVKIGGSLKKHMASLLGKTQGKDVGLSKLHKFAKKFERKCGGTSARPPIQSVETDD